MTIENIRSDLSVAFDNGWTATPISWPNSRFKAPETSAWVRFNIVYGRARNAMIASTSLTSRVNGMIEIDIYTPLNTGVALGYSLSETAKSIFHNQQFNRTQCLAGSIQELGHQKAGGNSVEYYQFRVSIPFYSYIT